MSFVRVRGAVARREHRDKKKKGKKEGTAKGETEPQFKVISCQGVKVMEWVARWRKRGGGVGH